jgi:hypothetical protein
MKYSGNFKILRNLGLRDLFTYVLSVDSKKLRWVGHAVHMRGADTEF